MCEKTLMNCGDKIKLIWILHILHETSSTKAGYRGLASVVQRKSESEPVCFYIPFDHWTVISL